MGHEDLVGLTDRELRMFCGEATHQHFKGGLYKYHGLVRDARDGEILCQNGTELVLYEHVFPHERQFWVRQFDEFHSKTPDGQLRFRKIA